jgi:hypothetical protein
MMALLYKRGLIKNLKFAIFIDFKFGFYTLTNKILDVKSKLILSILLLYEKNYDDLKILY